MASKASIHITFFNSIQRFYDIPSDRLSLVPWESAENLVTETYIRNIHQRLHPGSSSPDADSRHDERRKRFALRVSALRGECNVHLQSTIVATLPPQATAADAERVVQ